MQNLYVQNAVPNSQLSFPIRAWLDLLMQKQARNGELGIGDLSISRTGIGKFSQIKWFHGSIEKAHFSKWQVTTRVEKGVLEPSI